MPLGSISENRAQSHLLPCLCVSQSHQTHECTPTHLCASVPKLSIGPAVYRWCPSPRADPLMTPQSSSALSSRPLAVSSTPTNRRPYRIHTWRDVFVCVDTGRLSRDDYGAVSLAMLRHADRHPTGIGFVVVVPENATPPGEEARLGIKETYDLTTRHLRCVCWVVEGRGFQAGMARAVLTGIRMFQRRPYPTHVTTDLQLGLAWTLPHLDEGRARLPQTPAAALAIAQSRRALGEPT
jgi:hypothetical protein